MAGFSDLSNELILEILQHVRPTGLLSACSITKSISLLAAPILEEHRRLRDRYSVINNVGKYGHPLAKLLVDILANPRTADYVSHLTLDCWMSGWDRDDDIENPGYSEAQENGYEPKALQLFRAAIEPSEIINVDEIDGWLQAIQDGTEDPILALLLLHLPNLDSLEILSIGMPIDHISRTTQRIQQAPAGTYLSHLKRVSINFDANWEKTDMMKFFMSFMSLPSLVSCHIEGLLIDDEERDSEMHLRLRKSNVIDLAFAECHIGEKALFEVLSGTKHLKSFSWMSHEPAPLFATEPLDCYWLGIGLLHRARRSLEKLTLLPHSHAYTEVCSLREFEVLQEITTNLALFFKHTESSVQSFPEMLPASIRVIRLRSPLEPSMSGLGKDTRRIREAILDILKAKKVLLPQLTEIHVFIRHSAPISVLVDIPKACEAQGVSFRLL